MTLCVGASQPLSCLALEARELPCASTMTVVSNSGELCVIIRIIHVTDGWKGVGKKLDHVTLTRRQCWEMLQSKLNPFCGIAFESFSSRLDFESRT